MKNTRVLTALLATALIAHADLLPPAQDSSSLKGKLTPVTGKATTLSVSATRKGYVLFNIESIPSNVLSGDIANARLRVYFPAAKKPGDIAIHTVTSAWSEVGTVLEPGVSVSPVATFPTATVVAKTFVEVDVTSTVKAWIEGNATNNGFAFVASGLTNILIGAKEGAGSGYPCELEVQIDRESPVANGSIGAPQLATGAALENIADGTIPLTKLSNSSLSITTGSGLTGGGTVTFGGNLNLSLGSNLTLGGTTTGTFSGNGSALTGVNAASFTGNLAGDVTGTQGNTFVAKVGGVTAANVATGVNLANAATNLNTAATIVKRDANGNFSAGTITASTVNATTLIGDASGLTGLPSTARAPYTAQSVALLKWGVNQVNNTYDVGMTPSAICFDGTNVWVVDTSDEDATKINTGTGNTIGAYASGHNSLSICFDGTNIWIANYDSNEVRKLDAATGAFIADYPAGSTPNGLCYDGASIWVTNFTADSVTKLDAATGNIISTYNVGTGPVGICFDGANIWTANYTGDTVTKINAATGAIIGTYNVGAGSGPVSICFDGASVWTANYGGNSVTRFNAATGIVVGTYNVGTQPDGICFDGASIWVANNGSNNVNKLNSSTGATIATYGAGANPRAICFDGANIWVVNEGDNTVTKL